MSFWKRFKEAAFGTSQIRPDLVENELNATPPGPTPIAPPLTSEEHHHQAVRFNGSLHSEDDSRSACTSEASVIDITPGTRENAIVLVDYSDSDLSDEADKLTSLAQPRTIPPPPEFDHNEFRIRHRTEEKAIEALDAFAQAEGFGIKKSNKYTNKEGFATRILLCVRGGPTHYTKVSEQ